MKKLIVILILTLSIVLTSCEEQSTGLDYDMFESLIHKSYQEAENKIPNRYILYYYSESCSHCNDVKQEILTFIQNYDGLDVYLMNVGSQEVNDSSQFSEFRGTPSLFIIAQGEIVETYVGTTQVRSFIEHYRSLDLSYDTFSSQYEDNFDFINTKDDSDYLIYYYNGTCDGCELIKQDVLEFAFSRSPKEVIFVDKSLIDDSVAVPYEIDDLTESPALIEMSYDMVMATHEGPIAVRNFIESYTDEPLDIESSRLEYSDFAEEHLNDYSDTLVIDDNTHLEYFYSPYCSACKSIKNNVLTFFDSLETLPFYLIDISTVSGELTISELSGIPTLLVVVDNEI